MSRCLAIAIMLSLGWIVQAWSAQGRRPSAAKENAEGDPSGAIRALGAAGYNDHEGRKPPAVIIPPLVGDKPRTGGLPSGTR